MQQKLPLILCIFLFVNFTLHGQSYPMSAAPITTCSGTFYDPGGAASNYADNTHLSTTLCSDGSAGTHLRLDFSGVDLVAGDELCFYDGQNTGAPLLSCASNYNGQPFVVQATAVNASGCLTVAFDSDGSGNRTGWSAVISCAASCQQVLADLVGTNPPAIPADTGWIDVCPGKRIFFNGKGLYPQNNFAYPQSDLTTKFEWNFGDGGIAYGPNVSHRYDNAGGYFVQLVLTDGQGCKSTNLINQRVRVAPRPHFDLSSALDPTICAGDTIQLSAAVDSTHGDKAVIVKPASASFAGEASRADSLALPDGTGIAYQTTLYLTEFSPGQVLTNPNDLESICVNMEHSWVRDVQISIACPNGQSIILHDHPGNFGSQVFLGIPNDNDAFNPVPGTGWDYCWTNNATNPTWLEYANTILPAGGGTLPAGDYTPFEPISNLVGCPLNGEWTITVVDLWPIDNGYIFSWGLKFNEALYPDIEAFSPDFLAWNWRPHPSIFYTSADSIAAAPQNAGTAGYTFTVTDEFGCSWDTLVAINVLPFTHPDCYRCQQNFPALPDTAVCAGDGALFNAASLKSPVQEVKFESYPLYPIGNGNHPPNNPYLSPIAVNSLGFNFLNTPLTQVSAVCVDITTDFDADLSISLRSPDNKEILLSSGNGAAGDNYKITCFKPGAATNIIGSTAPFNGDYIPEGAWSSLQNATVNGDWKLVVSDAFGINQLGNLNWWSIAFNSPYSVNYAWTNTTLLSCPNCPTPTATPSSTTTYMLTAVDNFNCIHRDTSTVQVLNIYPAPTGLGVGTQGADDFIFQWDPVPGASAYQVSVNGGPWEPANGNLVHTVSGLALGDVVHIEVQAISNNANCPAGIASANAIFSACTISGMVNSIVPVNCFGGMNGGVIISVSNSNGPSQFFPDGVMPGQPNGDLLNQFTAGDHFVIVQDTAGCRDTVDFTIPGPPPFTVSATATNAVCNGDNSGSVSATAMGGTGAITFSWRGCAGGPIMMGATVPDLFAGCYSVTATDANGCSATATATIGQPPPFVFQGHQDSVSCFGGSDGIATINVSGGVSPFTYKWDNGDTTKTADGLNANFHFVTVTDAAGCEAATFVVVLQPSALVLDTMLAQAVKCFGDANGQITVQAHGGVKPYSYAWGGTGQTTQTVTGLTAGTYFLTISDVNGCSRVGGTTIATPLALGLQFTSVKNEKCTGACDGAISIALSGGTLPYHTQWSNAGIPQDSLNANNLCAGSYTVTVTDANGCSLSDQATIQAAAAINLQFQSTTPSCAASQDGLLSVAVTGGVLPLSYLWNNGATAASLANLACGTYTVTITDANGCTKTGSFNLPCPASVTVSSITPSPVKCFGESNGQVAVVAQGGSGTFTYQWSDPNVQQSSTAINLPAGTYIVTVSDSNGCSATASATVTQPQALGATLSKTDVVCFGESTGSVSSSISGGTQPYSYTWTGALHDPNLANVPAGSYALTVSDANGCTLTAGPVTVGQPATALSVAITQTFTPCNGISNASASAAAAGGNGGGFSYAWSNGTTGAIVNGLSGQTTYSVTATDAKGCTAVSSIEMQEWDTVTVNVVFTRPSCNGEPDGQAAVNLAEGGAGGGNIANYNYQWSAPGSGNTILVTGLAGDQYYTVTATDNQGCSGSFTFYLDQPAAIGALLDVHSVSCNGASDGSITVSSVQGSFPAASYLWSSGQSTATISGLPPGDYTVTITDTQGCSGQASATISEPELLTLGFQIKPLTCAGDSNAMITALPAGGTTPYSYAWSNGGVLSKISNLPAATYTLTLTDAHGCTAIDTAIIEGPGLLAVETEVTDVACFGGSDGRVHLLIAGGAPPFRYSVDGIEYGGSSTFIMLPAGNYNFYIRDANGCVTTANAWVAQPQPIDIQLNGDTTILFGESVTLTPTVQNTVGLTSYEWKANVLDSIFCQDTVNCQTVLVHPLISNIFTVKVTDENGCEGRATVKVTVEKPRGVYVPTGFSPNGDGENDFLQIHGKSRMVNEITVFRIFDRWGEMLYEDQHFEVNDSTRGWDGTFRGEDLNPGVYVWYAEVKYVDGFQEVLSGNVMLIR